MSRWAVRSCRPVALQPREDVVALGEAALVLLREDELAVREHVELALVSLLCAGAVAAARELGRETRVPASGGAVEDANLGHARTLPAAGGVRPRKIHRPRPVGPRPG